MELRLQGSDAAELAKTHSKLEWSIEEHNRFLEALSEFGRNDAQQVADRIRTRNRQQVHSHAQKYFQKVDLFTSQAADIANDQYRNSYKEIEWNLLQNGVLNEPNYEWCQQVEDNQQLILGNIFKSQLKGVEYFVLKAALKELNAKGLISFVPDELIELQLNDNEMVKIVLDYSSVELVQKEESLTLVNLAQLVFIQDQYLSVFMAANEVKNSLDKIYRLNLMYEGFLKHTQDYACFVIQNLAQYERISEETVCCLLLCLCIESML